MSVRQPLSFVRGFLLLYKMESLEIMTTNAFYDRACFDGETTNEVVIARESLCITPHPCPYKTYNDGYRGCGFDTMYQTKLMDRYR